MNMPARVNIAQEFQPLNKINECVLKMSRRGFNYYLHNRCHVVVNRNNNNNNIVEHNHS